MRNLLEEFHAKHGIRPPTILGVREHVFTGRFEFPCQCDTFFVQLYMPIISVCKFLCSVSSLAWFMSNQETSFVTLGQRVLAKPLK